MALAGTDRGTGNHNSSSTTLVITPASNFAAESMAVVCAAFDNSGSGGAVQATTVVDSLGHNWDVRVRPIVDPGAANAGQEGVIATAPMGGTPLTTSNTITVNIPVAAVAKTWTLMEVTAAAGFTPTYVTGAVGTSGTGTTSPTITTGSIPVGDMVVAALVLEAGTTQTITQDADATNGSWSTQQTNEIGSTTSGSNIASQRKVVTGAATQTYNPTLGILGDLALGWIEITESRRDVPLPTTQPRRVYPPVIAQ
jgi:hypothetical protein